MSDFLLLKSHKVENTIFLNTKYWNFYQDWLISVNVKFSYPFEKVPCCFYSKLKTASHWNALCQVWLKSRKLYLRRSLLKTIFTLGPFLTPYGPQRGQNTFYNTKLHFSNRGCFLPNLVEIGQSLIFGPFWRPLVGPFLPQFFFHSQTL